MALKMIHLDQRLVKCHGKALCERGSHQKGAEQPGAACKSDSRDVGRLDAGTRDRLTYNRYYIHLMRS